MTCSVVIGDWSCPHSAITVCGTHRTHQSRYGEYRVINVRRPWLPADRDEQNQKQCRNCLMWLPTTDYYNAATTVDRLAGSCKACVRLYQLAYQYGLDPHTWAALTANGCQACGGYDGISVDHDHSCCPGSVTCGKCVRGALCRSCNTALGLLNDSAARLDQLARYLKEFS